MRTKLILLALMFFFAGAAFGGFQLASWLDRPFPAGVHHWASWWVSVGAVFLTCTSICCGIWALFSPNEADTK